MAKGLINFLLSNSPQAKILRHNYVFRIIPMLNPDGVIYGNYHCNLLGHDLNRHWKSPERNSQPTVTYAKEVIRYMAKERRVALYCDLHAHSMQQKVFMYGCVYDEKEADRNALVRVVPFLMAQVDGSFSYEMSKFQMEKYKESSARIVAFKEFGITNSYTCEASFFGLLKDREGSTKEYETIGENLCRVIAMSLNFERMQEITQSIADTLIAESKLPIKNCNDELNIEVEKMETKVAGRDIQGDMKETKEELKVNKLILKQSREFIKVNGRMKNYFRENTIRESVVPHENIYHNYSTEHNMRDETLLKIFKIVPKITRTSNSTNYINKVSIQNSSRNSASNRSVEKCRLGNHPLLVSSNGAAGNRSSLGGCKVMRVVNIPRNTQDAASKPRPHIPQGQDTRRLMLIQSKAIHTAADAFTKQRTKSSAGMEKSKAQRNSCYGIVAESYKA
eukprot:TRINITY_DN8406_c0_g1_i12.p1 TRINITY_DN8406_c0_g1~~TRINITY_DN8406_c0_g1_i12.p1  ORF type:complete len:450 (+),score=76.18 TRINITY_DN8406_c0_g1_i12:1396-2745(+)